MGSFGQVRRLRGEGLFWTNDEIEGTMDIWNFLLTIDIEGDHLSLPCPYLVCVKGVGQG